MIFSGHNNNYINNLIIHNIIGLILYLYLHSLNKWALLPQLNNSYPKVPPMQKGTDIGWEYIPQTSAHLSHGITYGLMVIGLIKISIYSYIKNSAHVLYYLNIILIAHLLYINTIIVTRLPDTNQDNIICSGDNLYAVANCSQKIPSGHTITLVVTAYFLSVLFPKYTLLYVLLLIIGIYFVLSGRLHRSIDVFMGIIVGVLLCMARPSNKIYSLYFALGLILLHFILLYPLIKMKKKYTNNK